MKLTEIQKSINDLPDDARPMFDHIRYLFPIDEEYKWFLQWIGFSIQKPATRCQVTPLHISIPHGTGRGSLTNMIMLLVGSWNCSEASILDLSRANTEFNGQFLKDRIMVFIHEVQQVKGRYEIDSYMRSVLSDKFLDVNVKYGQRGSQRVFVNFLMFSNHVDALVINELDRRINVLTGPDYLKPNKYYTDLVDWIEDAEDGVHGGIGTIFQWFLKLDLSDFNAVRSPDSPGRRRMINASKDDDEAMVDDFLISNKWPYMTMSEIREQVLVTARMSPHSDDFEMGDKQLSHILLDSGCVKMRQQRIAGNVVRLWKLAGSSVKNSSNIDASYVKFRQFALSQTG